MPRRLPSEEIARRGEKIFHDHIAERVRDRAPELFVGIDVETRDYELGTDEIAVSSRLRKRHDDPQIWMRCVGSSVTRRYGRRQHL